MKKLLLYFTFLFSIIATAQNVQLADNYFDRGEFEKAIVIYEELEQKQPANPFFTQRLVACWQQMEQYAKAEALLKKKAEASGQPVYLVELGYNYQLQQNTEEANKYYDQAIAAINENPGHVYTVAKNFEDKVLVERAISAYETATAVNKNMNFDFQMALLQGQLGNIDLMVDKLLSYVYANQQNLALVRNQLTRFMNEDSPEKFNEALRKSLLVHAQQNQDIFWNRFLSWFFVQQRDYGKAFMQEKAIYRREPESLWDIVSLGMLAFQENEYDTTRDIFGFVLENTQEVDILLRAEFILLSMDIATADAAADAKEYAALEKKITAQLERFGTNPNTLNLQLLKANFEAFSLNNPDAGIATLNNSLKLNLNRYQEAQVKMKLSDILLLEEKFNQAIIYYSQIEEDLKNDAVAHEATLKVAKSSYYKGDFEWAQKQLKVLKSSASQLIANDALELYLLITDNTVEDSTQTALKKFARADFKLYQNKKDEALAVFKDLYANDPTESIKDVTLLRMGKIYESRNEYELALQQYKEIIEKYKEGIYVDEALFFSAEIYNKKLSDPEKAKALYEKVLFEHQDSIYFVEARKQFRELRGDNMNS